MGEDHVSDRTRTPSNQRTRPVARWPAARRSLMALGLSSIIVAAAAILGVALIGSSGATTQLPAVIQIGALVSTSTSVTTSTIPPGGSGTSPTSTTTSTVPARTTVVRHHQEVTRSDDSSQSDHLSVNGSYPTSTTSTIPPSTSAGN